MLGSFHQFTDVELYLEPERISKRKTSMGEGWPAALQKAAGAPARPYLAGASGASHVSRRFFPTKTRPRQS